MKETYLSIPGNQQVKPGWGPAWSYRDEIILHNGRVSDIFRVEGGPVIIVGMLMQITEALSVVACNMAWMSDDSIGGAMTVIGDNLDISGYALGDWVWAECDGTALIRRRRAHRYLFPL